MKIIVFGGTGLLGKELTGRLKDDQIISLSSKDVRIEDSRQVMNSILEHMPDGVINCAAIANPDLCQEQPHLAYGVNAIGARNIAVACQHIGCKNVYISTDHVFDGHREGDCNYTEFDIPSPINVYGKSKVAGEGFTQNLCDKYYIVRTSILFGIHRETLVTRSINEAKQGKRIIAPSDQLVSPTYVKDLALMIRGLLEEDEYGIYHLTNSGACSRYDLVKEALKIAGYDDIEVIPVPSDFSGRARRPLNVVLRNYMIEINGRTLARSWQKALQEFIRDI